jgi:butyryl-CoA dehydrogenase
VSPELAENGTLISNDVVTSGVYHKMGYRGCPIAQLSIGDQSDCRGWLVGEAHQGLRYMFQMMNEARIGVGLGATSMATAAYYAALDYAKTRKQGRRAGQKDPSTPQVAIIEHPDVKRMLLFQKAVVEGSLSLLMQCSRYVDLHKVSKGPEKENYGLLLDLLTPVVKTYPSEMGIQAISQGLQCLGGSGYCDDYPLEQYYRDARIHPIHEGTTAIQAMDLLGRKVTIKDGLAMACFIKEVTSAIIEAKEYKSLWVPAEKLKAAIKDLESVTNFLTGLSREKGPEFFLADAVLYLEFFGIVAIGWQWLLQGIAAEKALVKRSRQAEKTFYMGKLYAMRYFFAYEIPKIAGINQRLWHPDGLTVDIDAEAFFD